MIAASRREPRGYALIELLVLITVVAVILGLCGGLIHLLMKLDRGVRAGSDQAADMARLARDFRADAHAATPSDQPDARTPGRLALGLAAGRSVEYLARAADILRTVREGDKVRRRETYRRPARSAVRFDLTREGSTAFVSLILDRPAGGPDGPADRDLRIDAALGKDGRFAPRDR